MKKIAYIFPGQGAQKVGMGKDFYDSGEIAKTVFDQANAICGGELLDVMFHGPEEKLTQTAFCQPAILTMSIAALKTFENHPSFKNVQPVYAAGLSLGEYTSLAASQTISFEDTLKLVLKRGALMEEATKLAKGSMAAVIGFDKAQLIAICQQTGTEIANFNSHEQIVITGHADKVLAACEAIKAQGCQKVIPLQVSGAFHSSLMKPAADQFVHSLGSVRINPTAIKVVTNVNGQPQHDAQIIRENLAKQITASVQWVASMEWMMAQGVMDFVEIGPGKVLKGLMRRINPAATVYNIEKITDLNSLVF